MTPNQYRWRLESSIFWQQWTLDLTKKPLERKTRERNLDISKKQLAEFIKENPTKEPKP